MQNYTLSALKILRTFGLIVSFIGSTPLLAADRVEEMTKEVVSHWINGFSSRIQSLSNRDDDFYKYAEKSDPNWKETVAILEKLNTAKLAGITLIPIYVYKNLDLFESSYIIKSSNDHKKIYVYMPSFAEIYVKKTRQFNVDYSDLVMLTAAVAIEATHDVESLKPYSVTEIAFTYLKLEGQIQAYNTAKMNERRAKEQAEKAEKTRQFIEQIKLGTYEPLDAGRPDVGSYSLISWIICNAYKFKVTKTDPAAGKISIDWLDIENKLKASMDMSCGLEKSGSLLCDHGIETVYSEKSKIYTPFKFSTPSSIGPMNLNGKIMVSGGNIYPFRQDCNFAQKEH